MSFNCSYYRRELPPLLHSCIHELRKFDTENDPTNEYGYNIYLERHVNLCPFKELDSLICDIVNDNDTIEVPDVNEAANVFVFMSLLSDRKIINKFQEEEDRYSDEGFLIANKKRVCYPLIAIRAIRLCDWYMLGKRLMPRVIIGGEHEIKRFFTDLLLEMRCKLPGGVSMNEFYDKIYLNTVPSPGTIDAITRKYFSSRKNDYLEKKKRYSTCDDLRYDGKRFLDWIISCGVHANVRHNPSLNLW